MAVKLRLARTGRHGYATYRIVAADSRSPRDGRFLEIVGTYNPNAKENGVTINKEAALKWLNTGAQPTDTVKKLFKDAKIMKEYHETKKEAKAKKGE